MIARQLWLCLRLHTLALDLFYRAAPAAQYEAAVAVHLQQKIVLANAAAATLGIHPGMTTNAARALLPAIVLIKRDERAEQKALAALAQHCYRFTPMVVIKPPTCLLLEIKGSLRLFGGAQSLLAMINDSIEALGFHAQTGLGHTPLAAYLLSHSEKHDASALQQPSVFHEEEFLAALKTVPLACAMDDDKLCLRLQRMGWRQLGDLLQQPSATLAKGFGASLVARLKKITGDLPDPQVPIKPRTDFQSEIQLAFALGSTQGLLFPMQRLLQDLQQFLVQRQLTSHAIEWQLRDTRRQVYSLSVPVSTPQYQAAVFRSLTQLKLEALKIHDAIEVITLISKRHSPLAPPETALFRETRVAAGNGETMADIIDRLRARLGHAACQQMLAVDEVLPELATQLISAHDSREQTHPASAALIRESAAQPLWLLPSPQRLPYGLHYRGTLHLVSGAQRIQSYWWGKPEQRDYYNAQHDDGARYWVFRQLPDGPWFLHGIFS